MYPQNETSIETQAMGSLTEIVTNVLRSVADPCGSASGLSVVDMGIIHSISRVGDTVYIKIKPTTGLCPHTAVMMAEIKSAIIGCGLAQSVEVDIVRLSVQPHSVVGWRRKNEQD